MTTNPIDKSKKSNRRCQNCRSWKGDYIPNNLYPTAQRPCIISGIGKYYYNCCKKFGWSDEKTYLDESSGGKA